MAPKKSSTRRSPWDRLFSNVERRESKHIKELTLKLKAQLGRPGGAKPVALGMHLSTLVDVVEGIAVAAGSQTNYSLALAYICSPVDVSSIRLQEEYTPTRTYAYNGIGWRKFVEVFKDELDKRRVQHLDARREDYTIEAFTEKDVSRVYRVLDRLRQRYRKGA